MQIPTYTVDLRKPVKHRWHEQAADKWARKRAQKLLDDVLADIPALIPNAVVTSILAKAYDAGAGEYAEELRGYCNETGIDYGESVFGNLAYEFSQLDASAFKAVFGCSSVGFHLPGLGMVHARNLDWPLDEMEKSTCLVRFIGASAGEFTAVTVPGLVGVLSAVAPGRFSATVNYAYSGETVNLWQGWSVTLLLRHIFETCTTYDAALKKLKQATPICSAFIQLVGVEEGEAAIVELWPRSKNVVHKSEDAPLAITNHYLENEAEEELEADADGDLIQSSVPRRQALAKAAGKCKATTLKSAAKILLKHPVFNDDTRQSMVFHPRTGGIVLNPV